MKHLFTVKSNRSFTTGIFSTLCLVASRLVFVTLSFLSINCSLSAQSLTPSNPAKFGVDGDIFAGTRLQGSFTAAGSHDWFQQNDPSAYSVFDTAGAAEAKSQISSGQNYSFSKKMLFHTFSVQDGLLMLDGTYSRDYFGTSSTGSNADRTAFVSPAGNNKSSSNPSIWSTAPLGNSVLAKSDLIDAFIHMRRNGTSISAINPSNLFIYFAASTLNTNGDHFLDFELFKSDITYSPITGLFSNSGPAATGGRSIWEFNPDGSIKAFGDLSLSFSFNNSSVSEIAIYIWVPYSVYSTVNPTEFDFDRTSNNGWAGSSNNSGYGYAHILPNPGKTLQAWGAVNQVATPAPAWGTNSSNLGASTNNYFSNQYSAGQLAEGAIDLTSIGIDPALTSDYNRCAPPYVKVLVKSRTSSAFSSSLQDFIAPFPFLNNTETTSSIIRSNQLSCTIQKATLTASNIITDGSYHWSTTDGHIVSGGNSTEAVIDQPGSYTLSSAVYEGCPVSTETITVSKDGYQPVAQAGQTGVLTNDPTSYVTLRGGSEEESNYPTPFGNSQGLLWYWTGPQVFTSNEQNPKATKEGTYQLIVTEKRNGCTDTVWVQVAKAIPLALTLQDFSAGREDNYVQLNWQVSENESGNTFEIQRSMDGQQFSTITLLFPTEKTGFASYAYKLADANSKVTYYRLKLIDKANKITYSKIISLEKIQPKVDQAYVYQHPGLPNSVLHYQSNSNEVLMINLYNPKGILLKSLKKPVIAGPNTVPLPVANNTSVLLVELLTENNRSVIKVVN
ncbi:hypothetical protein [Flavisolibacter tropicus]|uniref:Ig-like domain-containing protein n=1 Tax=Flavisolibacter tropicus TaxID=1492898 RepID=A0A172U0Y1_9BACT|nr:hypothetical protein [Flavisolibacter tropicus]ANE52657.1 hypothetical protein SY85_21415 [Flavisolibacter tropicus]